MSTHQPRSSASSSASSAGGAARKPLSRSAVSSGGVAVGVARVRRPFLPVCCPASRYGVSRVRPTAAAQFAAAMETVPGARPNCASMAEWLDGMRP